MKTIKNIKLRKINKPDMLYFLRWWKDKKLVKLTSGVYEKSDVVLKRYFLSLLQQKKNCHYMILLNKEIIGNVSLAQKSPRIFEMYIVIGEKKYWGKGLGTLVIKKILKIAFGKLNCRKVYLEVQSENLRAINAYKKCGFKKVGRRRCIRGKKFFVLIKMEITKSAFKKFG
ncbi:MAG: hypothetical protein AUK09_01915 [Parcubacteria group bacterium CG2_30_36_38]|nr:MAG: hypothetical protein AUK09_01915 [Parcubacteria group bacterium CG2_30_36_38]